MKKATVKEPKLIKSFEEACKIKGLDPDLVIPHAQLYPEKHRPALVAMAKLFIIAEVLNGDWIPDWDNDDEWKYYPYFWMDKPGFRFDDSCYAYSSSYSTCGSRLCFRTRKLSDYAGETFIDLYRDLMTLPK